MSEVNDGGPAFPVDPEAHNRSDAECRVLSGMSLRDYFAGQAVIGLLANDHLMKNVPGYAYEIADSMIKARQ